MACNVCKNISKQTVLRLLKSNCLLFATVLGVIIGFSLGFGLQKYQLSEDVKTIIGMPGKIYIRILMMVIIPLVVSALISGTATMDSKMSGKLSVSLVAYCMVMNAAGALIGIVFMYIFNPGQRIAAYTAPNVTIANMETLDVFLDLLRNIFPNNILSAAVRREQTFYERNNEQIVIKNVKYVQKDNLLGILFFTLVFGFTVAGHREVSRPIIELSDAVQRIILKMINKFILITPIGVASLVAFACLSIEDSSSLLSGIGYYTIATICALLFQHVIFLPLIYFVFVRKNPFKFYLIMIEPMITTFSAGISIAMLPAYLKACERQKFDKRISQFVLPITALLKRDGSAVYVSASLMLLAQMQSTAIVSFVTAILILLLSTIFAVAMPPIPSGSIVALYIISSSLNVSTENIGILLTVEWLLDRCRSTNNGLSYCYTVGVMDKFFGKGDELNSEERINSHEEDETHDVIKLEEPEGSDEKCKLCETCNI